MPYDRIEAVARAAGEVLDHGLIHGRDVLRTIETTLGGAGPEDLAALLADRDSSDAAPLVELLLSPGEEVQVRLEPVLERAGLSEEEGQEAAELLAEAMNGRRIVVALPDGIHLAVELRPSDCRTFLRRLRPDRTPPAELAAILDAHGPGSGPNQAARFDRFTRFKIRLRHSRLPWSRTQVSFLVRLLAGLAGPEAETPAPTIQVNGLPGRSVSTSPPSPHVLGRGLEGQVPVDPANLFNQTDRTEWAVPSSESMSALDWALTFLDSIGPDEPPLAGLGLRYRDTFDRMRQAERVQGMLARSNVETLRMQGVLMSLPHPDELKRTLDLMNLICRTVTGRPASTFAESPVSVEDLGSHVDPVALIHALRRTGD